MSFKNGEDKTTLFLVCHEVTERCRTNVATENQLVVDYLSTKFAEAYDRAVLFPLHGFVTSNVFILTKKSRVRVILCPYISWWPHFTLGSTFLINCIVIYRVCCFEDLNNDRTTLRVNGAGKLAIPSGSFVCFLEGQRSRDCRRIRRLHWLWQTFLYRSWRILFVNCGDFLTFCVEEEIIFGATWLDPELRFSQKVSGTISVVNCSVSESQMKGLDSFIYFCWGKETYAARAINTRGSGRIYLSNLHEMLFE